jgi:hypothetical protein
MMKHDDDDDNSLPEFVSGRYHPESSKEAAVKLNKHVNNMRECIQTVVEILKDNGPLTDGEIEKLWGKYWPYEKWSRNKPSTSRIYAREGGLVKWTGEHRLNPSTGVRCRTWGLGRDEAFFAGLKVCACCGQRIKLQVVLKKEDDEISNEDWDSYLD